MFRLNKKENIETMENSTSMIIISESKLVTPSSTTDIIMGTILDNTPICSMKKNEPCIAGFKSSDNCITNNDNSNICVLDPNFMSTNMAPSMSTHMAPSMSEHYNKSMHGAVHNTPSHNIIYPHTPSHQPHHSTSSRRSRH